MSSPIYSQSNPQQFTFSHLYNSKSYFQNSFKPTQSFGQIKSKISKKNIKNILVEKCQVIKQQQIFQWRKQTDFPIVKVNNWQSKSKKLINQKIIYQFNIQLESQLLSLKQMDKISSLQAIYIVKQSLVGFQRLYHKFGSFAVETDMIKFNKDFQCKVWVNKDPYCNYPSQSKQITEEQFIYNLFQIIQNLTIKSKLSQEFFNRISLSKYFLQAIQIVDYYVQQNKITVPKRLQILSYLQSNCQSILNIQQLLKQDINAKLTKLNQKKIPTFIKNNIEKKNSVYTSRALNQTMPTTPESRIQTQKSKNLFNHSQQFLKDKSTIKLNYLNTRSFLNGLNIRQIDSSQNKNNQNPNFYHQKHQKMYSLISSTKIQKSLISNITSTLKKLQLQNCNFETNQKRSILDKRKLSEDIAVSNKNKTEGGQKYQNNGLKYHNLINEQKYQSKSLKLIKPFDKIQSKELNKHLLQNDQQQQENNQILRKNILDKNGWSQFKIFSDLYEQNMKKSIVDQKQIPIINPFRTFDLQKLGGMGRQVRSSRMSQFQFKHQFQQQIQRQRIIRNQLIGLLQ